MIIVTVTEDTEDGKIAVTMTFDDRDLTVEIDGTVIVCRNAVAESAGAPIWQRVAHAAAVAVVLGEENSDG